MELQRQKPIHSETDFTQERVLEYLEWLDEWGNTKEELLKKRREKLISVALNLSKEPGSEEYEEVLSPFSQAKLSVGEFTPIIREKLRLFFEEYIDDCKNPL